MTRALQAAPITLTQPLNFLQLIWATILGILLFGDPLDPFVLIGGAVIIGSATYISHRELRRSRLERERRIADI
jgi:drug/metabolite transporter (DMT)-like permease